MVDLSYNFIAHPLDFLEGLHSLHMLDFTSNQIVTLQGSPFRDTTNLENLVLSSNLLTNITASDLKGLTRLTRLHLNQNFISSIEDGAFDPLTFLDDLDLSVNQLKRLDEDLIPWDNIQKIYLHDNPWICDCGNQWLLNREIVLRWNLQTQMQ